MKNNKFVYIHIRLDTNDIFYVGVGTPCKNCKNKANKYYYRRAYTKSNRNIFWKRVVTKTEWKYEILFDNLSKEDAEIKEIELIKKYGKKSEKQGTLVNLSDGGLTNSGWKMPEKSKITIKNKMRGRVLTEEHKDNISKNSNPYNKGKLLKEEVKNKISSTMKGKNKGINNPFYRKKHSDNTINKWKNKERNKGKNNYAAVLLLDNDTGIYYETLKEASFCKNIKYSTLKTYFNSNIKVKNKTTLIKV